MTEEELQDRQRAIEDQLNLKDTDQLFIATLILIDQLAYVLLSIESTRRTEFLSGLRKAVKWRGGGLSFQHHKVAELLAEYLDVKSQLADR